jgi:hypothetical protein
MSHVIKLIAEPFDLSAHAMAQTSAGGMKPEPAPFGDAGYPSASIGGVICSENVCPELAEAENPAKSA